MKSLRPTLRRGSAGETVVELQQELNEDGYTPEVDGHFGPETDGHVRDFQADHDLDADGVVGGLSWAALLAEHLVSTETQAEAGTGSTEAGTGSTETQAEAETAETAETEAGTGSTETQAEAETAETAETEAGTGSTETEHVSITEILDDPQVIAQAQAVQTGAALTPSVDAYLAGLDTMPRGADMTAEQREFMRYMTQSMTIEQIKTCFEHRFGLPLQDTTGAWTADLARGVWRALDELPDGHVTGNTVLTAFQAISGVGGFGPSWEAPETVNTIQIGDQNDPSFMGHTIRHEIGHAVHADSSYMGTINSWLQRDVGFWFFPDGPTGLTQWVQELGGFGGADEETIVEQLVTYVGSGGSWDPARPSFTDGLTPDQVAAYEALPDNVREGITQSVSNWYYNYANWATGTRGKYHLNYWYARGFYMGAQAEACVDALGSRYTAMSEKEFFADCYAEFFKDPAGYSDHSKWGGNLPGGVQAFFRAHILEQQPYTPPDPATASNQAAPPKPTGMAGTP